MLDSMTAKLLLDKGWSRDGSGFVWRDNLGSSMRFEPGENKVRLTLSQDDSQVLAYEIELESKRIGDLIAALVARTDELAGMNHGGFSKDVAGIATEYFVE